MSRRLPLLVAAGVLLTGCEEDMGQDGERGRTGNDYLVGVGPTY